MVIAGGYLYSWLVMWLAGFAADLDLALRSVADYGIGCLSQLADSMIG